MRYSDGKQEYLRIQSHTYIHCQLCDGVYLYSISLQKNNSVFTICAHCGHKFRIPISSEASSGVAGNLSTIVAVVEKEDSLYEILQVVQKFKNGLSKGELLRKLASEVNAEKFIHQAVYLGLLTKTQESDPIYCISYKGREVLETCKS